MALASLIQRSKIDYNVAVEEVQKQLERRITGLEFKIVAGSARGPEEGFYDGIMDWKPDAVISSTADGGSCAGWLGRKNAALE